MKREYLAALLALLCLVSVQITTIWLVDAGLILKTLLTTLTVILVVFVTFFAQFAKKLYRRLSSELQETKQLFNLVGELTEEHSSLTTNVSKLNQAKEDLVRQQTKVFHLLEETRASNPPQK